MLLPQPPLRSRLCFFFVDIGTSSTQWDKNPTGEQDICRWNRVYENYIDTHVSGNALALKIWSSRANSMRLF